VHKHLAQQQPLLSICFVNLNSLMPLALPRAGVGEIFQMRKFDC
jgi:hypothetical protein